MEPKPVIIETHLNQNEMERKLGETFRSDLCECSVMVEERGSFLEKEIYGCPRCIYKNYCENRSDIHISESGYCNWSVRSDNRNVYFRREDDILSPEIIDLLDKIIYSNMTLAEKFFFVKLTVMSREI